mmetsp:Transcript_26433/g.99394  ORF Transcript_26433/g.99394 Transcript_26433/m.99394 type:complete len:291 (+) Transcript_26433:903-1775(+)
MSTWIAGGCSWSEGPAPRSWRGVRASVRNEPPAGWPGSGGWCAAPGPWPAPSRVLCRSARTPATAAVSLRASASAMPSSESACSLSPSSPSEPEPPLVSPSSLGPARASSSLSLVACREPAALSLTCRPPELCGRCFPPRTGLTERPADSWLEGRMADAGRLVVARRAWKDGRRSLGADQGSGPLREWWRLASTASRSCWRRRLADRTFFSARTLAAAPASSRASSSARLAEECPAPADRRRILSRGATARATASSAEAPSLPAAASEACVRESSGWADATADSMPNRSW